jgi:hypothetical protein
MRDPACAGRPGWQWLFIIEGVLVRAAPRLALLTRPLETQSLQRAH